MICCAYTRILLSNKIRRYMCFVLMILEFVGLLMGVSIIVCGVYIFIYFKNYANLINDYIGENFPIFLIITGIIMVTQHLFGLKIVYVNIQWRQLFRYRFFYQCLTYFYLALSVMGLILFFFAGFLCLFYGPQISLAFKHAFLEGMNLYSINFEKKLIVDEIQIEFECCGGVNYKDWTIIPWISNEFLHKTEMAKIISEKDIFVSSSVPFSCCNPASPRPCIHRLVDNEDVHFQYNKDQNLTIFRSGCVKEMTFWINDFLLKIFGLAIQYFCILEIVMIIIFRFMHTSNDLAMSWGLPSIVAPGYFLLFGPTPMPPDDVSMNPKDLEERLNYLKKLTKEEKVSQRISNNNNNELNANNSSFNGVCCANKNLNKSSSTNCNYSNSTKDQLYSYPATYISSNTSFDHIDMEYTSASNSTIKKSSKTSKSMDKYTYCKLDNLSELDSILSRTNICIESKLSNFPLINSTKRVSKKFKNDSHCKMSQMKYCSMNEAIYLNSDDNSSILNSKGTSSISIQNNSNNVNKSSIKKNSFDNLQHRVKCQSKKHNILNTDSIKNNTYVNIYKSNNNLPIKNSNNQWYSKTYNLANKFYSESIELEPNNLNSDSVIIDSSADTNNSYSMLQKQNSTNRSYSNNSINNCISQIKILDTNNQPVRNFKTTAKSQQSSVHYFNNIMSNENDINGPEFFSKNSESEYKIEDHSANINQSLNESYIIQSYINNKNNCNPICENSLNTKKQIHTDQLNLKNKYDNILNSSNVYSDVDRIDNISSSMKKLKLNSSNISNNINSNSSNIYRIEKLSTEKFMINSSNNSHSIKSNLNSNIGQFGSEFSHPSNLDNNFNNSNFNSTYISQYTTKYETDSSFSITIDSCNSRYNLIKNDSKSKNISKSSNLKSNLFKEFSILTKKDEEGQVLKDWVYAQQFSNDSYFSDSCYSATNLDENYNIKNYNELFYDTTIKVKKINSKNNNGFLSCTKTHLHNGSKQKLQDLHLQEKHNHIQADQPDMYIQKSIFPMSPSNSYCHHKYQNSYNSRASFSNYVPISAGSVIPIEIKVDAEISCETNKQKKNFKDIGENTENVDHAYSIHNYKKYVNSLRHGSKYEIMSASGNRNVARNYEDNNQNWSKNNHFDYMEGLNINIINKEKVKKVKKHKVKNIKVNNKEKKEKVIENDMDTIIVKYKDIKEEAKSKKYTDPIKEEYIYENYSNIINKNGKEILFYKDNKMKGKKPKSNKHRLRELKRKEKKKIDKDYSKNNKIKDEISVIHSKNKKDRKKEKKRLRKKYKEKVKKKREKKRKMNKSKKN